MITRTKHIRLLSSNNCQFDVILVQQALTHFGTIGYGDVRKEPLDLLLELIASVRNVTS